MISYDSFFFCFFCFPVSLSFSSRSLTASLNQALPHGTHLFLEVEVLEVQAVHVHGAASDGLLPQSRKVPAQDLEPRARHRVQEGVAPRSLAQVVAAAHVAGVVPFRRESKRERERGRGREKKESEGYEQSERHVISVLKCSGR